MPELPAPVVVSRRVVGLARPEESRAIDEESGVIAGRNRAAALLCDEPERHGATLDGHNLGDGRDRRTNKRRRHMVNGDMGPHGGDPVREIAR